MKLLDATRLAGANLRAARGRNLATAIVIGVLFGLLLGVEFILTGLERNLENYANRQTNNIIYVLAENTDELKRFNGERIEQISGNLLPTQGTLRVNENETIENFNLIDFLLDGIRSGSLAGLEKVDGVYRAREQEGEQRFLVKFTDAGQAYDFIESVQAKNCSASEIIGNHTSIYARFLTLRKATRVIKYILLVVAVVITVFTLAHLLSQETATVALYRTLGATKADIMLIYFLVLLGIMFRTIIFALGIGLALSGIVTLLNLKDLGELLPRFYQTENLGPVILIGVSERTLGMLDLMILVAPLSFLLTLDQISGRGLARRLKE